MHELIEGFPVDRVTTTSTDAAISVDYDSASQVYTVTAVPAGETGRSQTWGPADRDAAASSAQLAVYSKPGGASGTGSDKLTLSQPGTTGLLLYSYVGGGIWQRSDPGAGNQTIKTFDSFVYGVPTADAGVPRVGTGSYWLDLYGKVAGTAEGTMQGIGQLDADFATGNLTVGGEGQVEGRYLSFTGSGAIASAANALSGTLVISVTGGRQLDEFRGTYTGPFSGSFFGPGAEEFGATFRAVDNLRINNNSPNNAVGWLLGRPLDTTSGTLQQLTSLRKLNGVGATLQWDVVTSGTGAYPNGTVRNAYGFAGFGAAPYAYPSGEAYYVNGIAFLPPDKVAAESNDHISTFSVTKGNTTYTLRTYHPGPTNDALVLSYASLLDWQRTFAEANGCGSNCATNDYVGTIIAYGLRTDPAAIPLTGSATYTGLVYGRGAADGIDRYYAMTGTASLLAQFGSDQLSGTLSPTLTNMATGNSFAIDSLTLSAGGIYRTGPIDTGTNALIVGTLTGGGSGTYSMAFFGPNAEELGGAFTANNIANPEAAGSPITIAGGVLAKRN